MQYTISDMAKYIKNIIPPTIPKTYSLKAMFRSVSGEENIRNGVLAFRDLLYLICDSLIDDGSLYDKANTQSNVSHQSLPVSYPFLNNVKSILFNIGYHGELIENGESILINDIKTLTSVIGAEGRQLKAKISGPKLLKALKFLNCCGIYFDGIDLDARRLDISKTTSLKISYPDNPVMFIGLKTMAIAQKDLYSKGNHDIFLRCDYRVLKDEETETISILKDFVTPLPKAVQDFALKLHQRYLNAGLTCRVDVFYLGVRFIYSHKNKEIWTFSAAHDSGYRILIKAQKTHLYSDVIDTFPLFLQQKISRGYGCNKKLFGEPCQKGCHGFSFSLDDSILDISHDIEVWLDKELSCLHIKNKFSK
ncbi:hypothetical protein IMX26_17230 [Clostridium sp. 'deep sea']|uniref:hypothetical protein n=1 Tax=Clostridium sp. 'deep sea' TaxID=2779445 RepID=UPI0018965A90|nr:hypothetical protein [Clostridium sp. 'deep sea']QOR35176.1 hypothetical protein IMX26_17230 [Clostridium sp. 'deep sea']